jgi:ribosomal protein S18 acetylase RimI-like enzyme
MSIQSTVVSPKNLASIPTLISHTALDSLQAKISAIDGGWLDGHCRGGGGSGSGRANPKNDTVTPYRPNIHDTYCKFLQCIHNGVVFEGEGQSQRLRRRRQTPLVNAGYAARIAVMTFILERWLERVIARVVTDRHCCHSDQVIDSDAKIAANKSTSKDSCINVVLLGCGMDALGICSKQFLHDVLSEKKLNNDDGRANNSSYSTPKIPRVKVYEFDAWDNCLLKRRALVESGILVESSSFGGNIRQQEMSHNMQATAKIEGRNDPSSFSKALFRTISKGRIVLDNDDGDTDNDDDYFLMAMDIRETIFVGNGDDDRKNQRKSILSLAMKDVRLDVSQPTVVLSELVLAYLGYDGANGTLHSIAADVVGGNHNSLFVCLEPVFPSESDIFSSSGGRAADGCGGLKTISVEESYAREYSHQFLDTLQRGDSVHASKSKGGRSSIKSSLWIHPLGSNLHNIKERLRNCGFSSCNICHATLGEASANVAQIRRVSNNARSFLRAKEPFDEHAALALNLNCYGVVCVFSSISSSTVTEDELRICPWFRKVNVPPTVDVNPIDCLIDDNHVRDLYGKLYEHLYCQYPAIRKMVKTALKTDLRDEENESNNNCSAIQHRYLRNGGNFWVAVDTAKSLIVGCVGVGLRNAKGKNAIRPPSAVVEYEIHRLAVSDQYRGLGIGTKLLSTAEEYISKQESGSYSRSSSIRVKLWAVTPNCLINANQLYDSLGYKLEETFLVGSLCMNVYCKAL